MRRLLGSMNLKNKLMFTLVLFILVPLILVGYIFYERSSDLVVDRTDKEAGQVLNLVQRSVDQLLKQIESDLLSIYEQDAVIEEVSRMNERPGMTSESKQELISPYLRSFLLGKEQVDSVYLIPNNEGVYFADFKGSGSFMQELSRHPEWTQTISMADGRAVWFPTYEIPPNPFLDHSNYYIPVGMQIKNVADVLQPLGTFILNVKIQSLDQIIGEVSISPHNVILITDSQGQVVWHRDSSLYGSNFRNESFYKEAIGKIGTFTTQRLNGELYRVGSTQSDYNDWYYFSFIPLRDLEEQSENMIRFFISTIVAFTALFVLLAWLTTHYITKPIRQMAAAMKRIQKDNLGKRLRTQSFDEIGLLQSAFNSMQGRINDLISEIRVVSEKEREAEVRALQAQINPHVLYNTLDTINWMAIERNEQDISSMITALGDIMRYAIRHNQKLVMMDEELKWAQNYAYLQKMRFEDRFDIVFKVDESVLQSKVPRLFLQPYLENSIIHGMENKESGGLIAVEAGRDEKGRIRVVVEDNGSGIAKEKLRQIKEKGTHGVGMNNLDERLKLEYGHAYGVTIESSQNTGTTVVILLPELDMRKD